MPIRKTEKGWYWGSKGPFKTRKKALSVQGAAYASGYKDQSESLTKEILIELIDEILEEMSLEEKRKPYDKAHGRKYKSDAIGSKKQKERNKRKRDKYHHDKKNGKCPDGQELHHTSGLKSSSVKCEPVKKNRGRNEKSRKKSDNH